MAVVEFGVEAFAPFYAEAAHLFAAHHAEIMTYMKEPLDVDRELYERLDREGGLAVVTARADGRMAGYAVFLLSAHPHYRLSLQAVQAALYLEPSMRRG